MGSGIRASASGSNVPGRAARTRDAHEEVAERVVEFLNVRQHAHRRMVRSGGGHVYAVPSEPDRCIAASEVPVSVRSSATPTPMRP